MLGRNGRLWECVHVRRDVVPSASPPMTASVPTSFEGGYADLTTGRERQMSAEYEKRVGPRCPTVATRRNVGRWRSPNARRP